MMWLGCFKRQTYDTHPTFTDAVIDNSLNGNMHTLLDDIVSGKAVDLKHVEYIRKQYDYLVIEGTQNATHDIRHAINNLIPTDETFSDVKKLLNMQLFDNMRSMPKRCTHVQHEPDPSESEEHVKYVIGRIVSNDRIDIDVLMRELYEIDSNWNFDVIECNRMTDGHALIIVSYYVLWKSGVVHTFGLDTEKLIRALSQIERGYCNNPYHNAEHATEVLQRTHIILQHTTDKKVFPKIKLFACYIAAIIHDYNHVGLTNEYLKKVEHRIALMYNGMSPMESYSIFKAFEVLGDCFKALHYSDRIDLRQHVVSLVMATDMTKHFQLFQTFCGVHCIEKPSSNNLIISRRSSSSSSPHATPYMSQILPKLALMTNTRMCTDMTVSDMCMIIKCADIGHTCMPLPQHVAWVKRLEDEFFNQGDAERMNGLDVTPLFDRNQSGITKSQTQFFNLVVLPMFEAMVEVFPNMRSMLDLAMINAKYWKDIYDQ